MRELLTYLERLREIALDQHGFVTTAQAVANGIPKTELPKLAGRGRIERVAHGVYRISQVPATPYDNWALAVLWTGAEEACLSHETALAAWDVSDVNPDRVHLTVGRQRRLRRAGGERYVIHRRDLDPGQRTWWEAIPITDLPTTIADCIETGTPTYLIRQSIERGGRTRLLPASDLDRLSGLLEDRDGPEPDPQPLTTPSLPDAGRSPSQLPPWNNDRMGTPLVLDLEAIRRACKKHRVTRLRIFGSAITDRFDPQTSDVDFLVDFAPDNPNLFHDYFDLKAELEEILGRPVDLVDAGAVRNPYFKAAAFSSAQDLYAA